MNSSMRTMQRKADRVSDSRALHLSADRGLYTGLGSSTGHGLFAGIPASAVVKACATNDITSQHPWAMFATKKVHGRRPKEYSP